MSTVRELFPGMGQAVAERTIARRKEDGTFETWSDISHRVAQGNALLNLANEPLTDGTKLPEVALLQTHIAKGNVLMSGRHLQHGDIKQPERNMEVFVNCATAPSSFLLFYNLLNGAGVGRSYDDDVMLVNWDNAPTLRCVIDEHHADYDRLAHESVRDAQHKYGSGKDTLWFKVPDSREGWAKAVELWENAAFEKIHKDKMLILDFSDVRPKGSPIGGMQDRPSSGPVALMNALNKACSIKGAKLEPWQQAMYIDHYLAECVLVGGARRAARMAVKHWKDASIFDFIQIKRPIEYMGKSGKEIQEMKKIQQSWGFLWSSNNSVAVDDEFWKCLAYKRGTASFSTVKAKHARKVFKMITECAYYDGTGEPGLVNAHKLAQKDDNIKDLSLGDYVGSDKYQLNDDTRIFMSRLSKKFIRKKNYMIPNPCGEISIAPWGAFCTIADVVPYHADTLDEAEEAFRVATRALIRVNTMPSLYSKEVKRTNRIGVGMTGVHEFAWKFFGYGFKDLIDEEKSKDFWMTLDRFSKAVRDESVKYSKELGVEIPHTCTTIKPAGTTSKLFGLSEGWHLPARRFYLRWVQFRYDDPLVNDYAEKGYPIRHLKTYEGTVIVGFPTAPVIATLGLEDKLVLASEATPEEQYKWLQLGEKYYINGLDSDVEYGNQISYTLKYKPSQVDYKHFKDMILKYQGNIKCCSVLPDDEDGNLSFEYLPEQEVSSEEYAEIVANIDDNKNVVEDIDESHISCSSGACGINFNETK